MTIPNPGTDEAIEQGCTCPPLDPAMGVPYTSGCEFLSNPDCPLHDTRSSITPPDAETQQ